MVDWKNHSRKFRLEKVAWSRDGERVAILTIGHPGNFWWKPVMNPAFDMRFVPRIMMRNCCVTWFSRFKNYHRRRRMYLWEDWSAVAEFMLDHSYSASITSSWNLWSFHWTRRLNRKNFTEVISMPMPSKRGKTTNRCICSGLKGASETCFSPWNNPSLPKIEAVNSLKVLFLPIFY